MKISSRDWKDVSEDRGTNSRGKEERITIFFYNFFWETGEDAGEASGLQLARSITQAASHIKTTFSWKQTKAGGNGGKGRKPVDEIFPSPFMR